MNILSDLSEELIIYYDKIIVMIPKLFLATALSILIYLFLKKSKNKIIKILYRKADDKVLVNFANNAMNILLAIFIILTFLYMLGYGGIASSILGAAGVSAFIIGFAMKDIGENFLAGVIMAFDRPFRLGDTVKSGDIEGTIIQMSLRDTQIKTFDGKDVYIPNGQIVKNPFFNYTIDGFIRGSFIVGVDYGSDIENVRKIILRTVAKIPGVLGETKPPRTHVSKLNTSTIDIEVYYWIDTFNKEFSGLEIKSQALAEINTALINADVLMPATIVELKNYNESLKIKAGTL